MQSVKRNEAITTDNESAYVVHDIFSERGDTLKSLIEKIILAEAKRSID